MSWMWEIFYFPMASKYAAAKKTDHGFSNRRKSTLCFSEVCFAFMTRTQAGHLHEDT